MNGLLEYAQGDSFFHKLNPGSKLLWAVMVCAACFISDNHYFVLAMVAANLVMVFGSGTLEQSKPVLKALVIFGIVIMVAQVLVAREGTPLFYIGSLSITDAGVSYALLLMLRMVGSLMPLSMMLILTPMTDLSALMTEKFNVPYKYTFVVMTAMRFIPTFAKQMGQIIEAQSARGLELDTKNPVKKFFMILPLCIPLLISSVNKIDMLAMSIEIRGFGVGKRSCYTPLIFAARDIGFCGLSLLVLILSFVIPSSL